MQRNVFCVGTALLLLAGAVVNLCAAEQGHNYARWEKEIAGFEASDRTNPPPKDAWLFTGSSTIRMWKTLANDFPGQPTINRGFGGSEIMDATYFADRIIFPYAPSKVLIRAGGNDLHNGKSAEEVFGHFKQFVATVHARLPEAEVVYISVFPTIARLKLAKTEKQLNSMIKDYAKATPKVKFVDVYDITLGPDGQPRPEVLLPDKLHLNSAGYELLAARVRSQVK